MSFFDNASTSITLASLFIVGPAVGHALVSCFDWQSWRAPIQHLTVSLCTMAAVSGMILTYGYLCELRPASVAWYSLINEMTKTQGRLSPLLPKPQDRLNASYHGLSVEAHRVSRFQFWTVTC
jgi:hypothetical protein